MITPDYYEKFRCVGSECTHNCCRGGWDIEIDDDALERFKAIEGEFGDHVRAAVGEDNIFLRTNGQCVLLDSAGLCEMAKRGEKLCIVCDEYPRFTEFYDTATERGISLSCEAAADIIINDQNKVRLVGEDDYGDAPILALALHTRKELFKILQDRETDIFKRIRLALDYTHFVQSRVNENNYEICEYSARDTIDGDANLCAVIDILRELEILNDDWSDMLDAVYEAELSNAHHNIDQLKYEQIAVYFIYRYLLKGVFDCDFLSKMKFAALSIMVIAALDSIYHNTAECARMYSIEIEHNEDNIEAIYDEFLFSDELSYEKIINMIK